MKLRKLILKYFLPSVIFFVLAFGVFSPFRVSATGMGSIPASDFSALTSIKTSDGGNIWANLANTAKNIGLWATEWEEQAWAWLRDQGAALAYRKALDYFLQQLAYDTATYLATGDKGQSAMFYTESWGDYLGNVGDNAVGHFLEDLGANGPIKFDLCDPGIDVTARIGMGIMNDKNPGEPDCTYTEMKRNWDSELQRSDFLNRFGNMFEPQSNDFGIALSLQGEVMKQEIAANETAVFNRQINDGFKDVTEKVSGAIKTPGTAVRNAMIDAQNKSGAGVFTNTGFAVADAIDVFTSTLVSKLMKEWLKKGISRSSDNTTYMGDWGGYSSGSYSSFGGSSYRGGGGLTSYQSDSTNVNSGIGVAKEQFKSIIAPNFSTQGDYEALNELMTCSNPTNAKTTECVITNNFRQAIENRMTVAEATTKKYINKDGVFGFRADGLEPNFNEGVPYRSMIILRKYRIIPVGWELAAQYIMDHQNDLHRSLSLYDMIACFDGSNDERDRYHGYSESWCEGLVDPTWVLKAPQNFCKREGAGPYILSSHVSGSGSRSKLNITRDNNYCADEQTCIKENDDGTCELYGYCTEDKRKYNFDGESCDSIYNTCQSFRADDGRTIALLENTLDYGTSLVSCNAENAGCKYYKQAINQLEGEDGNLNAYNTEQDEVSWEGQSGEIRLDYDADDCKSEEEGCHEFIRTRPGIGANLLSNPSFEVYDGTSFLGWTGNAIRVSDNAQEGLFAMQITGDISRAITINPVDITSPSEVFDLEGSMFTLSLYVRDCASGDISLEDTSASLEATDWRFVSLTHSYDNSPSPSNIININITNAMGCVLDAVKLERTNPGANELPTRFTRYREAGLVYQKLIPAYLYESCYDYDDNGDGFIEALPNAPEICDDYVRYCTASEVNCEFYESLTDDFSVPAVVRADDYCPTECVGYDEYTQDGTNFEESEVEYFIPDTADTCSALAAGCDEFTNLDEIDDPEAGEYFVHMRQCINPDDLAAVCRPFFMWEGSDDTGYQLIVHQLNAPGGIIARAQASAPACSTNIDDLNYNPDCREFYDSDGNADYELYYNTISCTDDCHPYRRTIMDDSLWEGGPASTEEHNCTNYGITGEWSPDGYCIYMGVPSEGITCEAEEAGCREYNGNAGANTRVIFEHSFENGTDQNWVGGINDNMAVIVGEHSLRINDSARLTLGSDLRENRSYILQFLAVGIDIAGVVGAIDNIQFENTAVPADVALFENSNIIPGTSWGSYEINIPSLDHSIDFVNESLLINTTGSVNIDNIRLTEVIDRHFLIEDSWDDNCEYVDADPGGVYWGEDDEGHYAGCDAYKDRDNTRHNLFQFNHLCADSAVGCELLIDTHNYSYYNQKTWFDDNNNNNCDAGEDDCVEVSADNYTYVVYDDDKTCNQQDKGCERMGVEYSYEYPDDPNYHQYFDNYKLNNPDIYDKSLCENEAVTCDAWESRNGNSYFKDPRDMTCEWRIEENQGINTWQWFKKRVKRCDVLDVAGLGIPKIDLERNLLNSAYLLPLRPIPEERYLCSDASDCDLVNGLSRCETDDDCNAGVCVENECRYDCIIDTNDYLCDSDNEYPNLPPKTIGRGGPGSKIDQPLGALEDSDWVAVCPVNQDDCTEYIDPESTASFNVDTLEPYTLYVLDNQPGNTIPAINNQPLGDPLCSNREVYKLDENINRLVDDSDIAPGDVFYYVSTSNCRFDIDSSGGSIHYIRPVVVDYQLAHTLDRSTCNGMVDLEQNCILLNERNREGLGMSDLVYDADTTLYHAPTAPVAGHDANILLKVKPDRTCQSWLSCNSFIKDEEGNDVCYDIGTCENLDSNGNCSYFVPSSGLENQVYDPAVSGSLEKISNLTGYSKVGYVNNSLEADYYSIGDMSQEGQLANVPNGGFERYDGNMYPAGWTPLIDDDWERDKFRVINNPVDAQTENIDYPMDGRSFLKFGARDGVRSEPISMVSGLTYTLTFYVNTKNLALGQVIIDITSLSLPGPQRITRIDRSRNWEMRVVRFRANGNQNGRIVLRSDDGTPAQGESDGNIYMDNIQIKPTLNSRLADSDAQWQTLQSCRLYPKNDSLSCDYYDDGGHRKKGWPGYCLEYDRAPGNTDACLMWYPVDRVNGDGIEEGGNYIDRDPLYYCVGTEGYNYRNYWYDQTPADTNKAEEENLAEENNFGVHSSGDIDITHRNPYGFDIDPEYPGIPNSDFWSLSQLGLGNVESKWLRWDSIDHIRVRHSSPSVYCEGQLSPEWDVYYRFDNTRRGEDCRMGIENCDCVPWGTEHIGGSPDADDMEWWEWWGTISGFGWLFYHDNDDPPDDACTQLGGIRMMGRDSFEGILTSNVDNWCNHPDSHILEVVIFPKIFFCSDVIQTVTPMGQNQYYSSNVYEGSNEKYPCNGSVGGRGPIPPSNAISFAPYNSCSYMADLAPFGAVAQPGMEINSWALMSNPFMWDSREGIEGNQPLFYEIPSGSMFNDSVARMGQSWDINRVMGPIGDPNNPEGLFSKYYGRWQWRQDGTSQIIGHYLDQNDVAESISGINPTINSGNIIVTPDSGHIYVNQLVKLQFTTDVDKDHLPMTMYTVAWGDGSTISVSGIEMRDHPEREDPHVMYHIYSEACPGAACSTNGYTITITARDNWRRTGSASRPGIRVME